MKPEQSGKSEKVYKMQQGQHARQGADDLRQTGGYSVRYVGQALRRWHRGIFCIFFQSRRGRGRCGRLWVGRV